MVSGARVRREDGRMPTLDFDENLLAILKEDQDKELNEEILSRIVRPMLDVMRQLIRENPEEARNGLKVTIDVKSHDAIESDFLGTAEVAQMFRVSQQQVRRWCEAGLIRAERTPGGTWRIDASQFNVEFVIPRGRKQRRDIRTVAGAWKGNEEEVRLELQEGRD